MSRCAINGSRRAVGIPMSFARFQTASKPKNASQSSNAGCQLLDAEHAYRSHIEIRNLRMGAGTGHFGQSTEGVFGEVKNLGDQTVTRLVLTFELLDVANRPVAEREWTPVFEGLGEGPLKPNFTGPFGSRIDRPPSDWLGVRGAVKTARLSRQGAELPVERDGD
jgi:hypothetical protein